MVAKGQGHSKQWPENIVNVNTISQKLVMGISSKFGHRCIFACVHERIKFWLKGQRSRSQQAMTQNTVWMHIFVTSSIRANFAKIWSHVCIWARRHSLLVKVSGQKVKAQSHSKPRHNRRRQWRRKRYGRYGGRHTNLKFGMAAPYQSEMPVFRSF